MVWLVAFACQERVLEQVGTMTHISAEVTHRPEAVAPLEPAPAAVAAPAADEAREEYDPISVPEGARPSAYSMPGVGKKASPTGEGPVR